MQVTVKTLRHYEQKGLLLPYEVDEWTGYRYYSIEQMQRLNIIRQLQRLGFSLDEIKELCKERTHMPSIEQLNEKIEETERQLQQLVARRSQLLNWMNIHKKIKTMEIYNSILARETDPDVLFLRGRLNMELGNESAAAADFDKAATLIGDYDLYINIYQAYASHGKRADGSDYLERALKIVNTSQADYYNKGLVNYYLQNYDDAKSYLIQALDEDPEDSGSILLLGRVYLALNDVADARAMFNEYVDDPSTAPAAYNGLALCDMEDDDYEKALANVEKGLEYGNSTANRGLLFNEIIIYEHRRDWAMAKAKSAAYIAMYPADEAGLRENEFLSTR
jgi:DNA-binding transcriptional MerR regulator